MPDMNLDPNLLLVGENDFKYGNRKSLAKHVAERSLAQLKDILLYKVKEEKARQFSDKVKKGLELKFEDL